MPFCKEWTPRTPVGNNLNWKGYTYRGEVERNDHARLFQTGAAVKILLDTGWGWWRTFHLIVGMP